MHEQQQDETEENQGMGNPTEGVFGKNPLLEEGVDEDRLNDLKDFGTEKQAEHPPECRGEPGGSCGGRDSLGVHPLGKPY